MVGTVPRNGRSIYGLFRNALSKYATNETVKIKLSVLCCSKDEPLERTNYT